MSKMHCSLRCVLRKRGVSPALHLGMISLADREIPEFRAWFSNDVTKKDREEAMERSGIPLELRIRRVLESLGYYVHKDYYVRNGVTHELDFMATKTLEEMELPNGMDRVECFL
jgi:hypothetical protein